jgi:hypothetical protein
MTIDEQIEILQAAKRGEKIEYESLGEWAQWTYGDFDFRSYQYRIADPYAELKAAAKDQTKQIRCISGDKKWYDGDPDNDSWEWTYSPNEYEIRDKPKPKKVAKYLCWEDIELKYLMWFNESAENETCGMIRRPAFDKECEVEDE